MTGPPRTNVPPRDAAVEPLDWAYLERQTLGDRALQRTLLSLFAETAAALVDRIEAAGTLRSSHDLAHTLRGAAMAIGAHRVAAASARIESAPALPQAAPQQDDACRALREAVAEACAAIAAVDLAG